MICDDDDDDGDDDYGHHDRDDDDDGDDDRDDDDDDDHDDGDDDDDDAKCVFTGITLHSKIPHIYPTNLSICHSRFPRFEFPNGSMQFPGCARTVPPAGLTAEA